MTSLSAVVCFLHPQKLRCSSWVQNKLPESLKCRTSGVQNDRYNDSAVPRAFGNSCGRATALQKDQRVRTWTTDLCHVKSI